MSMTRVKGGVQAAMLALGWAIACGSLGVAHAAEPDIVKAKAEKAAAQAEKSDADRERQLEDARKRLDEAAREVAELSMSLSEDSMPRQVRIISRNASRVMLGVNIGGSEQDEKRTDGVEILSVSPGGPAAEAGLKAGDVLTEIKGKALKKDGSESPREKLLMAMREVEPEQKVVVKYLRGGKAATATIAARPLDRVFTRRVFAGPGSHLEHFPLAFMRSEGVFGSAELVGITPKLGQYFGTEKGLLVVRAPSDSRLKLEEGDVIVDIDGRVPSSPSHAMRILESYQSGEKLKLGVLRMKKRMTMDVTVPEQTWEHRFDGPGDVLMPVPPVPPAPPSPGVPAAGARSDTA